MEGGNGYVILSVCQISRKQSRSRMGLFTGYRADRLIAEVRESGDPGSPKAKQALARLQGLGPTAVKPISTAPAMRRRTPSVKIHKRGSKCMGVPLKELGDPGTLA